MIELPKLSEVEEFATNPFVLELKGKMYLQPRANTIVAKGQEIVDTTTGEVIQDDVLMGRRRVVDKSQFAKIYASEIGVFFGLTKPAISVFMYLAKVMDYDQRAYFDIYKDYKEVGYNSYVAPMKGVRELIGKNIIAKDKRANTWWLNPLIICKGERFAVYTEYVTQERHEKDMEARRIAEQQMRIQGTERYNSLDDKTQSQIKAMNEAEEKRYYQGLQMGQGRDMFTGEVFDVSDIQDKDDGSVR